MEDERLSVHSIPKWRNIQDEWIDFHDRNSTIILPEDLMVSTDYHYDQGPINVFLDGKNIVMRTNNVELHTPLSGFTQIDMDYTEPSNQFFQSMYSKIKRPEEGAKDHILISCCLHTGERFTHSNNHERSRLVDPFMLLKYDLSVDGDQMKLTLLYDFIPLSHLKYSEDENILSFKPAKGRIL